MQVRVEESGCLEFLRDRIALEAPIEALHLSCHGTIKNECRNCCWKIPGANVTEIPAPELMIALGDNKAAAGVPVCLPHRGAARHGAAPGAEPGAQRGCQRAGLGRLSLRQDASEFAHVFYGELARMRSVGYAAAIARQALLRALMSDPEQKQGRHWHLARVYWAAMAAGRSARRKGRGGTCERSVGYKEFLDKKQKVPVAPAHSFVGRRRQAQQILGIFRDKEGGIRDHAGVLIHGMGRLGKSSLAARVANRLPHHKTVVVFNAYRAHAVLDEVLDALPAKAKREFRGTGRGGEGGPRGARRALREILEGPCSAHDPASGRQPILLVVDDLEQILEHAEAGRSGDDKGRLHPGPGAPSSRPSRMCTPLRICC